MRERGHQESSRGEHRERGVHPSPGTGPGSGRAPRSCPTRNDRRRDGGWGRALRSAPRSPAGHPAARHRPGRRGSRRGPGGAGALRGPGPRGPRGIRATHRDREHLERGRHRGSAVRPRGEQSAAGSGRAWLLLLGRRAPRHADGLGPVAHGCRCREHLLRGRPRPSHHQQRRGALRASHRTRHRGAPTAEHDRRARRRHPRRDPRGRSPQGWPPGTPHVPGDPDRGQP